MAKSFELTTSKSIDFESFTNFVSKTLDPRDITTLEACVEQLQMLSNNNDFLVDFLNKELTDLGNFQKNNYHTSQSVLLHRAQQYYIRMNIWPPMSARADIRKWQEDLYFYLRAHDHNFSFLTVGYYGLGYGTEIWEYDSDMIIGYVGEKVDMKFSEITTLPKGKVMMYRASTDIHSQFAPEEYSLSLNIMPLYIDGLRKEQFYFDLKEQRICGVAANGGTGRYLMLNLAGLFGDSQTVDLLNGLASNHEVPYVRLKAYDALTYLTKDRTHVWTKALSDNSLIVSQQAKMMLNGEMDIISSEYKEHARSVAGFRSPKV